MALFLATLLVAVLTGVNGRSGLKPHAEGMRLLQAAIERAAVLGVGPSPLISRRYGPAQLTIPVDRPLPVEPAANRRGLATCAQPANDHRVHAVKLPPPTLKSTPLAPW